MNESVRLGLAGRWTAVSSLPALLRAYPASGPVLALVTVATAVHLLSGGEYWNAQQASATAAFVTGLGIVALGVTLLMISGEYDLSVSQSFAVPPIIMGALITRLDVPPVMAAATGMAVALLIGVVNGYVTVILGVPSFIATLGMLFLLTSLGLVIATTSPPNLIGIDSGLLAALGGQVGSTGLSAPLVWMLLVGGSSALALTATRAGSWVRAAGSRGGAAARAMGVPVNRVKLVCFCACSALAGFGGIVQAAEIGVARPDMGQGFNLLAIVAAVVGGASLFGGRGSAVGTLAGVALLGVLSSGLVLLGVDQVLYTGIVGLILLLAAYLNVRLERGGGRRSRRRSRVHKNSRESN